MGAVELVLRAWHEMCGRIYCGLLCSAPQFPQGLPPRGTIELDPVVRT